MALRMMAILRMQKMQDPFASRLMIALRPLSTLVAFSGWAALFACCAAYKRKLCC